MRPDRALQGSVVTLLLPGGAAVRARRLCVAWRAGAPIAANAQTGEAVAALQAAAHVELLQRLVQGSPAEQAGSSRPRGPRTSRVPGAAQGCATGSSSPARPSRARPAACAVRAPGGAVGAGALSTGERALAVVELQRVDAELRVGTESHRLASELDRERARSRNTATADAI